MGAWINKVASALQGPLPGRAAQLQMASMKRLTELSANWTIPDNPRIASVIILLFQDQAQDWRTVLIQRTQNPNDRHSGQISFPGGSWDHSDASLEAVALREAQEEVGIAPQHIEVLGRLTELYIPVSNFLVHPFVGHIQQAPVFVPQPGEVAQILTPPVRIFFDNTFKKTTNLVNIQDVPYFDVEDQIVWGATAMIMNEFITLVHQ